MKKILAIIPAVALAFAFSTSLALAYERNNSCCIDNHRDSKCCPSVEINNSSEAATLNNIKSSVNTGYNKIISTFEKKTYSSRHHGGTSTPVASAEIFSGNAASGAYAETGANDTKIVVGALEEGKTVINNTSRANTTSNLYSSANTGYNFIAAKGDSFIGTGDASSASESFTLVNSTVIRVK